MHRYCPNHKCSMVNGRYGWYCPNKVNGYWCKGESPAEQEALAEMLADEASTWADEELAGSGEASPDIADELLSLINAQAERREHLEARRRRERRGQR